MELNLLKVKLTEERAQQIKIITNLAKVLFVLVMCTGLFDLYSSYKLFKTYADIPGSVPINFKIQFWANIIFLVLYGVMLPLQTYFFYRFTVRFKSEIQSEGATEINNALRFLLYQTIVAVLLFGINSLWAVVNTFFLNNS